MSRLGLHVEDGAGEALLAAISSEVSVFNRLEPHFEFLSELAEMDRAVDVPIEDGPRVNLLELADTLESDYRKRYIAPGIARVAIPKIEEMTYGYNLPYLVWRDVELEVIEPGVFSYWTVNDGGSVFGVPFSHRQISPDNKSKKATNPHTVINGHVGQLITAPTIGGIMRLPKAGGYVNRFISGLVDPETGSPNVNLRVLTENEV